MSNDLTQQNTTNAEEQSAIEFKYLEVFTLRALGFKFDYIAKKTGFTSQYLRRLFMKGGRLHLPFLKFRTIAQQESVEEAQNVFFGGLPDVARTLVTSAQMPYEPSGVAAAKIIIEQTMGVPNNPQIQNNIQINQFNVPKDRQDVIEGAFKNFGVIEDETKIEHTNGEGNNIGQESEGASS